ncbi:hypothetical protein [Streptomyces sp. NPDC055060]
MGTSRLALRLAGTSCKETLEIAAEYGEKESTAYREILRAARAAEDAGRAAWAAIRCPETIGVLEEQGSRREGLRDVDELQNRLAVMRERLPEIERITNRTVARNADTTERQAREFRGLVQKHTIAAGELQEERSPRSRRPGPPRSTPGRHSSAPRTSSRPGTKPPNGPARTSGAHRTRPASLRRALHDHRARLGRYPDAELDLHRVRAQGRRRRAAPASLTAADPALSVLCRSLTTRSV